MTTEEKKSKLELRKKEIEDKRLELKTIHGVEVHAIFFNTKEDGEVVGYLKEPDRISKMRALDMFTMGQFALSASTLLETCLIKEESDTRILSELPEHDSIYLGFLMEAQALVKYYSSQTKKN